MSEARRRAFAAIRETCPTIDSAEAEAQREIERDVSSALADLTSTIKAKCTEPLRDALIEAYERIIELEEELKDARATADAP